MHLSDQELLLASDGELPASRAAKVHAHLTACWDCRARMAEVEATIADFARTHRRTLDPQLPPIAGPRALLRAQLAQMSSKPQVSSWRTFFQSISFQFASATRLAAVGMALLIVVVAGRILFLHSHVRATQSVVTPFEHGAIPDRSLTPGATRRVTISDVCSMAHEEVVAEVPTSLRQQVFREYGIVGDHVDEYEVDYLITPGLGGVEDIHNLWPEPSTSPTWNAHVKDGLEEHLHEMVCAGELDLPTAQRDIATNWIAAYKKYFHTEKPLPAQGSGLI
jgi:anti-sigma factor RsiW